MTQLIAANVQVLVEIVVGQDADLRALPNAQIPVKLRHHNHVQVVRMVVRDIVQKLVLIPVRLRHHNHAQVVRMVVRDIAQKLVRMLVKHRQRNTALIVPAIALLDVQPPVLMHARLRHRKAVQIVLHNVVEIVSMNVPMVVDDNVIRRAVVNAKVSVADHAR